LSTLVVRSLTAVILLPVMSTLPPSMIRWGVMIRALMIRVGRIICLLLVLSIKVNYRAIVTAYFPYYCKMQIKMIVMALVALSVTIFSSFVAKKKQRLLIVFIGDSITYGAGLADPLKEAPPVAACDALRKLPGIKRLEESNQGVSGFTTVDFLPSTGAVFNKVIQAARDLIGKNGPDKSNPDKSNPDKANPDKENADKGNANGGNKGNAGGGDQGNADGDKSLLLFSIMLGTNDSAIEGPNGSPVSPGSYRQNLKTIADGLLRAFPGCKILINRPVWYSPNTYNGAKYLEEGLQRLQSYFPEIDKLVSGYAATDPGHVYAGDKKGFAYFEENHLTDLQTEHGRQGDFFLHPNRKGAAALGQFWADAIYNVVN
jgi:lysophospholipase L1-like esterase